VAAVGDGEAAARLLAQVTGEVRVLLQEWQDQRKTELDAHQRDVCFAVEDEVPFDTEHSPLPSRSLHSRAGWAPSRCLHCGTPGAQHLPPGPPLLLADVQRV
jgi:hypothetical protein